MDTVAAGDATAEGLDRAPAGSPGPGLPGPGSPGPGLPGPGSPGPAPSRPAGSPAAAAAPGHCRCGEPGATWRGTALSGSETGMVIGLAEVALAFVEGSRIAPDRAALTRLTRRFARSCGFAGFVYCAARRDCCPYFLEETVLSDALQADGAGDGPTADVLPEAAALTQALRASRPLPVRLADGRAAVLAPVHGPEGLKAMLLLISDAGMAAVVDRLRLGSASLQLAASHLYMAAESLRLAELQGRPGQAAAPDLTRRERECMIWLARGKTAWEVARILGIRERTVTFHVENVKRKLGVSRRSQAIALLLQTGELAV